MLTVNMPVHLIAAAVRLLNKQPDRLANGIATNLLRTLEVNSSKPDDVSKPSVGEELKAPKSDTLLKETLDRAFRPVNMRANVMRNGIFGAMSTPERWPTPNTNDSVINAFGMLWAGIDQSSPSGDQSFMTVVKPDTESLRKIAKALVDFEPAWGDCNYSELLRYILNQIESKRSAAQERHDTLVERFNLLEKIRNQVGAKKWDEIISKVMHLQDRTHTIYPDTRTILKALPEESLIEAATRQMKNADNNATAAEILDLIMKDIGIQPGMDVHQTVVNLRDQTTSLKSGNDALYLQLERVRSALCPSPDGRDLEVIATARMEAIDGLHKTIGGRDVEISRLKFTLHDTERDLTSAQESADYRGKCLDQIADLLNLTQSQNTAAYVVEAVGVLKMMAKGQHDVNAETTLARIRSIMNDSSLGGEVQRQRVMELLK